MTQGHLYIGEIVHDYEETRKILDFFGLDHLDMDNEDLFYKEFSIRNGEFIIAPIRNFESMFPVSKTESYTDAFVGFPLTARYIPAIIDQEYRHGRPEPFVVDIDKCQFILNQVRKFWPNAQILLWENSY